MMAFKTTSKLTNIVGRLQCSLGSLRSNHIARLAPLEKTIDFQIETTSILPEFNHESDQKIEVPTFSFGGSMELMAVPKKKVSKHKKGIRNGPRALKPIPVIIRCRVYVCRERMVEIQSVREMSFSFKRKL
ncbi:hypothetical protein Scep_021366 [Stephania cephalantha]|uniref:Large ribosomal subunit protein bL32m n=1 Tax=Stephania cephalantha TaxID=152367 RepID=A0AAP0F8U9_9MAGN